MVSRNALPAAPGKGLRMMRFLLLLACLVTGPRPHAKAEARARWSWDRIVQSQEPIVANGNVWPPSKDESASDCLILVTRNQLMWHCPGGDHASYHRTIIYRSAGRRIRGAFSAPGTERRRLWVLDSPITHDVIFELDTVTGNVLQSLVVEGTVDGHDAVRVDDRVFIVDTRHGHVVEIALPASAPPYTRSSIEAGAEVPRKNGFATIIKRHTGFTRQDHVNNVAVHPDLLISNLHGKGAIRRQIRDDTISATRLSLLSRSIPEGEGRELNEEQDGIAPVTDVGTWCHGIAFWKDEDTSDIKLISLDSKEGSIVSVVLSGQNKGTREVIWEPDKSHPVLVPPEGIAKAYRNGADVFSKGLAVQGGVAYFGVSYARAPKLRQTVPESLLVAVDLATKREIWVRTVRSNGLINQILTQSYLGWQVQLPSELSLIEMTYHGDGGSMVEVCEDREVEESAGFCKTFQEDHRLCRGPRLKNAPGEARDLCCACGGGDKSKVPHLAGTLDREALKVEENITATATFIPTHTCLDVHGNTKRLSLEKKGFHHVRTMSSFQSDLEHAVRHLCHLNVGPIENWLENMVDEGFTSESQQQNGNAIITERTHVMANIKPGTTSIQLIFSARDASTIYHFPWLNDLLPMLKEHVLQPLGIAVTQIVRLMFANMPEGSTINIHQDKNPWVQRTHRVHVPIITHPDVFFLTEIRPNNRGNAKAEEVQPNEILRIRSNKGEAFEFNNAMLHTVRNLGTSRVHLILDWAEAADDQAHSVVILKPGDECAQLRGFNELQCTNKGQKQDHGQEL